MNNDEPIRPDRSESGWFLARFALIDIQNFCQFANLKYPSQSLPKFALIL